MKVIPYESVEGVPFGSSIEEIEKRFGRYKNQRKLYSGIMQYEYQDIRVRFDKTHNTFTECTFTPGVEIQFPFGHLEWTRNGLLQVCKLDQRPVVIAGAIILYELGIIIDGLDEDDVSDWWVSVFTYGLCDELKTKAKPFVLSEYARGKEDIQAE